MNETTGPAREGEQKQRWQPVSAIDRRVLGVLVEKAKTTPDVYPMSLNAVCTACNQKNNRFPLMQLEPDAVEESLTRLRGLGAVGLIQGSGRVDKYRHYLYEWLGVEKVELAVMAELLLRGAQTEGELRGRAARMEPIPDLNALRPVLASLKSKGLVVELTPHGRGHALTHALYLPAELEQIQDQWSSAAGHVSHGGLAESAIEGGQPAARSTHAGPGLDTAMEAIQALRQDLEATRSEVAQLRAQLAELAARITG